MLRQTRENNSSQADPPVRKRPAAAVHLPDSIGSDEDDGPPAAKRPAAAAAADLQGLPDAAAAAEEEDDLELPDAVETEEGVGSVKKNDGDTGVDWLLSCVVSSGGVNNNDSPMPQAPAAPPEIPVGPGAAGPMGPEPAGPEPTNPMVAPPVGPEAAAPPVGPEAAGPEGPEEISDVDKVLNKIQEFCASDLIKTLSLDEVTKLSPLSSGYLKLTAIELRTIDTQLGCPKCRHLTNGCTTCKQMETKQHVLQYLRARDGP